MPCGVRISSVLQLDSSCLYTLDGGPVELANTNTRLLALWG